MWKAKPRQKSGVCYLCGRHAETDIHHVFEGNGKRKISDEWDAVIEVCRRCHRDVEYNPKNYVWLKQKFQREIMARKNMTVEQWIDRMGKNYI